MSVKFCSLHKNVEVCVNLTLNIKKKEIVAAFDVS